MMYPLFLLILLVLLFITMPTVQGFSSITPPTPRKKLALVTGANKGIGKEIARRIGSVDEFTVLVACRNLELGQNAVDDLRKSDGNKEYGCCDAHLLPIALDLTNQTSIDEATKWVENEYGALDVLINNAAICFNSPTLYGKTEHTSFQDQAGITIQTNYYGTLNVIDSFLPLLKKSTSPRIINIASAAGRLTILRSQDLVDVFTSDTLSISKLSTLMQQFVTNVREGTHERLGWPNTGYGVSKLGIIALTKVLAREHHTEMQINSVDPGYCKTDQNNNQGTVDAARGAVTPYLLAIRGDDDNEAMSGLHFYEEKEISWTYQA